jgi:EmrB/QacA subfamily drug resistance transporter
MNQYQNKWYAFIGIALLSFGCYLDYTVVNVALPTIQNELQVKLTSMQWVMNIYFLALCVFAVIMGRLGDLYGRSRFLYAGSSVFLVASVIAGCAWSINGLILGRLLQGIGAAIIIPTGLSLLPQLFPEQERSKAIALFGSIGGMALAIGPLLGGLIVTYCGWRWIFFLNIPISLIGYLFCFKSVKESPARVKQVVLDIRGMVFLALTMTGLVLGLIYSQSTDWQHDWVWGCFLVAIISGFLLIKAEKNHPDPLINFSDFSKLLFGAGVLLCFTAGLLSSVTLFFDPIYLQIIKKQSAQLSGLVLSVIPISVFLMAFFIEKLVNRLGLLQTILSGLGLACFSILLQIFFSSTTSLSYIVGSFICLGCVWALGNTVSLIAAQTAVGPQRVSVATGTLVTLFNVGGSMGITSATLIYHWASEKQLASMGPIQSSMQSLLRDYILNPAHSLQSSTQDQAYRLFSELFMKGFTSIMSFLILFLLISVFFLWCSKVKVGKQQAAGSKLYY